MMHKTYDETNRRPGYLGRWLTPVALALLLSLTACVGGMLSSESDGGSEGQDSPAISDSDALGNPSETDEFDQPVTPDSDGESIPWETDESGETVWAGEVTLPGEDGETSVSDPHPGDSAAYRGVMISAVHGTGKNGAEAVVDHGFIQLYNNTDRAISLKGASLYYKTSGANPFEQFVFPDDASVPAGGYYLVRASAPTAMVESNLILKIGKYDAEWDIHIDNKEVRLLLAPSGWTIGRDEDITSFDDAVSVFVATVDYHSSVYSVDDLSRNKIAVRTAKEDYSGYHLVNLTRTTESDLQALCPVTSKGEKNEVVASRLNEVIFSHAAGVYKSTFYLELSAPKGYTIYYTVDGSDPSTSSTRRKYSGTIFMADTSSVAAGPMSKAWQSYSGYMIGGKVIKAYATNGSDQTPVYTNTYFVTDDLAAYGVTVMSISIPQEEMLGSGFYANPGSSTAQGRPRGTGIIEVFDTDGNRVGNSRVEMAVSGHGSSGFAMKSLRIYYKSKLNYNLGADADPAYPAYESAGTQSALNYDLFGGRATDAEGEVITSFSRLLLRNSGNDCGYSYVRDSYMQRVCAGLNVDTMASASVLVFVNGEFWGVYNARERYSPEYVESHYGIDKENVAILESDYDRLVNHNDANADFLVSSGLATDADNFNELIAYMREREDGLTDEDYAYIATQMDIDSFIDMWVARLYFNARDWPENNVKVWRNRNPDDPSGFDTKWHFTLLDMDMGISFFPNAAAGVNTCEDENLFWVFDSNSVTGMMMRCLISNTDFREQFILRYYELVKNYFTVEYLSAELEALIAERSPLMSLQQSRWAGDGASVSKWNTECEKMRSFVDNRTPYALQYFYEYFGVTENDILNMDERKIQVSFHEGRVQLTINGESYAGGSVIRFANGTSLTLTVKATALEGYTVTEIVYTDRNGNRQSFEGAEATFTVTESGSLSIMAERTGQNGEQDDVGQLVAGATYIYYLSPDGDLYAWGDNRMGVLGIGTAGGTVNTPTLVMRGVAKVVTSSGNDYENNSTAFSTAVLTTDGRVLTVGSNSAGQLGRNGMTNSAQWGEIDFDGTVVDISMGHDHLLIVDDKGDLWGVGSNQYGALGTSGAGGNVTQFQKIASNVEAASAGRRSTVYLTQDGRLWGLGDNRWKKLSLTHGDSIKTPVELAQNIEFIESGEHQILAINQNGQLYYAGWRSVDGFAQGEGNDPVMAEISLDAKVTEADIYFGDMVILTENGDAYVYGVNTGNSIGSTVTNGVPKLFVSHVADVAAGYNFTAYLLEDGRILIQGDNAYGQAGNGTIGGSVSLGEVDADF